MKKRAITLLLLLLLLCLCSCGQSEDEGDAPPEGGNVVISTLEADLLTGELPPAVASVNGDHAKAPCLLVGAFETDMAVILDIQISPEMRMSGLGIPYSKVSLPLPDQGGWSITDFYGVVSTLSTDGPDTILAVFPLTQLDPAGSGNQQWPDNSEGEYFYPVIICTDGGDCYLRSLMDGSLFLPATPLPPELTEKAVAAADIGTEVDLSHCGIAQFTILEKAEDGSYRIELKGFLCL